MTRESLPTGRTGEDGVREVWDLPTIIEGVEQLKAGADNIANDFASPPDLRILWRGKAIAYETVLPRLRALVVRSPVSDEQAHAPSAADQEAQSLRQALEAAQAEIARLKWLIDVNEAGADEEIRILGNRLSVAEDERDDAEARVSALLTGMQKLVKDWRRANANVQAEIDCGIRNRNDWGPRYGISAVEECAYNLSELLTSLSTPDGATEKKED